MYQEKSRQEKNQSNDAQYPVTYKEKSIYHKSLLLQMKQIKDIF